MKNALIILVLTILCTNKRFGFVSVGSQSRKRKLDMNKSTSSSPDNDTWNTIHLTLVRDLESKGIIHRYGAKHLKLWTDMIIDGRSHGIGEEPDWSQHLEEVIVPPKSRRSSVCTSPSPSTSTSSTTGDGLQNGLFQLMMMNQQRMEESSRRSEMLQTTLMTMMNSSLTMMHNKV